MINFIKTKEDPTCVQDSTEGRLHHIISQEILPNDVSEELLKVFEIGNDIYKEFRQTRFVKAIKLSETIHRRNLKTFETWNTRKKKK